MQTALAWLIYAAWLNVMVAIGYITGYRFGLFGVLIASVLLAVVWLWAEQYRPRPRVLVQMGRDWVRARQCCVFIGWAHHAAEHGVLHYRRSVELSWDWKPVLFYRHCYDRSRQWTGRERQVMAWSWWAMLIARSPDRSVIWHAR